MQDHECVTIPKRVVDGKYYVWQTKAYAKSFLYADEPADVYTTHPMPCTPSGKFIKSFNTAREADAYMDELVSGDVYDPTS